MGSGRGHGGARALGDDVRKLLSLTFACLH